MDACTMGCLANMWLGSRVEEIAKKKGVSMAQIAMAWIFAKPGVTAPIIGTTSMSNLEDILGEYRGSYRLTSGLTIMAGSLEVTLTEDEMKHLEEPYKPVAIIGHF